MLCGMFMFSAGDTVAKFLTTAFNPVQIIWFRQLGLLVGIVVFIGIRGSDVLRTKRPVLQMIRGVLVVCSSLLFVFAVKYVPLADAVAASFVAPFFLTMLGAFVLKEKVGMRRWSAVVVGFAGALIIVRPGMNAVHPAVLLVVIAAAIYAARQIIGRLLADDDDTATTIAYTALTSSLVISVPLPFVWVFPETSYLWLLCILIALLGAFGEIMLIKALEVAEAGAVAPMHYSLIVWGTLYGYLVFNQLPDQWTVTGTLIIVAAGIYTLRRGNVSLQNR